MNWLWGGSASPGPHLQPLVGWVGMREHFLIGSDIRASRANLTIAALESALARLA